MWTCHGTNFAFPVNKYDIEIPTTIFPYDSDYEPLWHSKNKVSYSCSALLKPVTY